MCGIAGFVRAAGPQENDATLLRAMCGAIRHRGPDEEGRRHIGGAALGMRRLSIIDVAGGHQPISNEAGDVTVVFNGEIYNYHELRDRLLRTGHRLATRSDTETLVHLYEDEGDGLVRSLRGMFAFAIWDSRRQRLLLARDRLGIKPLYYWHRPGGLYFASELRSFIANPSLQLDISREAVAFFLAFGYVPDPLSIFNGVRKLEPGHTLSWDTSSDPIDVEYWSPPLPSAAAGTFDEAVGEVRRVVDEAVRCHLESEVPLGAFLSGGLDSSAVVAMMARAMDRRVQTFSIGFEEQEYNEAPHAASMATALGTDHTEFIVRPDVDRLVEHVIGGFDEPFADSSAVPTLLVSHLARQRVTVALSGDGGDELFGGYTRYTAVARTLPPAPAPIRRLLRTAALMRPIGSRGRGWLLNRSRDLRGRYAGTVAFPLPVMEGGFANATTARVLPDPARVLDGWFDRVGSCDALSQMMQVDLRSYLPGDILTKVDRMSMAVSLEARVPLLDHRVVELASMLSSQVKVRNDVGKHVFREAVRPLLPADALARRKQGFALPLDHWFRGPLRHRIDSLGNRESAIYEWVDPDAVRLIASEHLRGKRDRQGELWRLVVLDGWLRLRDQGHLAAPPAVDEILKTVVREGSGARPA